MSVGQSCVIYCALKAVSAAEIDYKAMPYRKNYPAPENFEIEIRTQLTSLINYWVLHRVLKVDVLFKTIRKATLPRSPNSIVHYREEVWKVDLTAVSILCCKPKLCEYQYNILVEIVTNDPTDAPVTPTTMEQNETL